MNEVDEFVTSAPANEKSGIRRAPRQGGVVNNYSISNDGKLVQGHTDEPDKVKVVYTTSNVKSQKCPSVRTTSRIDPMSSVVLILYAIDGITY